MYDLVLKGGRIYDGSGMPSFSGPMLPSRVGRSLRSGG
jgi:N-acyl-D-aspartate/D-glutamate deacylase